MGVKVHWRKETFFEMFGLTFKQRWSTAITQRAAMCRCPSRRDKVAKARSGILDLFESFRAEYISPGTQSRTPGDFQGFKINSNFMPLTTKLTIKALSLLRTQTRISYSFDGFQSFPRQILSWLISMQAVTTAFKFS